MLSLSSYKNSLILINVLMYYKNNNLNDKIVNHYLL